MNSLTYIAVLLSIISLPAVLFTAFWMFVIKRGWGSKWLLATSITAVLLILPIVLSLGAQDNSILFGLTGMTILGGVGFYFWLRTSPISDVLIGKSQNTKNNISSFSEDERNNLNQSAKLVVKDIFLTGFAPLIPLIIGFTILLLSRNAHSNVVESIAFFVMGFTGIVKIVIRSKQVSSELDSSKTKMISNILVALFAWSLALHVLLDK